ncbi:hypothetical protein CWE15_05695 [Aliidiomarina taiwanensis]|uniref:DUF721 domain-containing protein n=1 Tax=Aliidiomarina taiwanensis TaxID=946228 RepID=A0A432X7R1_9GAMM|nr:DciA family protein [Aliidiomarina taiwanensis]RUO42893.1 hypothetical protein CWE15_05695 [Aliidiomarina taiwanensis]
MLNKPPKTLQQLLARGTLAELSQRSNKAEHLSALWQQAISKELAAASRCIGLRDGVLSVAVASAAWATRLKLTEKNILKNFKKTPEIQVKSIDIRVDPSLFKQ